MHDQDLIELKTLYRAAPVGLCMVDRDLRYVRINKWLAAINGKPPGEHIGRTIREIIPEVASQVEPVYQRVFESGEPILDVEIIGTLPAEPEVERSWRCSYYPIKSPDGMVERVSVVVEEITALKRVKQLLEGRLQFETLFSDLCATFTNLPDSDLDTEIARGLERIIETLNIDRVSLLEFSEDKTRLMIAHIYDYPDAPTLPGFVSGNLSPWIIEKIRRGEMLVLSRCPDDLPEEAIHERQYCLQRGLKSQLTLPLTVGGSILGAMAFSSYRRYVTWPEDLIQRLRIAAKVFANAMFRKRAEEALKNERQRLFTLLEELPATVAIKGPDYSVSYANRFYREVFGNIRGKRCYELVGRDSPCDGCRQIRVFETGEPQNFECAGIKPGQTFQIYHYPFAEVDGSTQVLSLGFDITERKQAEEALRQSEARYRSLVENIDLGITLIGTDYRIIMTNAAMGRMFQKPLSEFVGKECFRIFERKEAVCSYCPGTRVMASGRPAEVETEGIRDDFSRFPVRISAFPLFGPNGQVDGFIEVVEDITQRRRAEEALRDSEEKYRGLVETTHTGFVILDLEGKVIDANPEYVRLTGHNELGEIIGRSVIEWTVEQDRERNDLEVKKCIKDGSVKNLELSYQRKDGRSIPVEINATTITTLKGVKILSLIRDISQRKQGEEALKQSQARYRSLVENIDLGISLIGSDYRIIMTNAAMGRMFQKPVSEFVGKECFREFEKREAVCSHCPGMRVVATGRPVEVETEGVRDDASRFPVRLSAFPIFGPNGQVDAFIEMVEDITQRRRAEEALQASEETLRKSKESYQRLAGQLLTVQEAERSRLARELHDDLTQRLAALAIEAARLEHQPQSS